MNMLGEGNEAEDRVDIEDGDAVLAIDNKADDVDALRDAGKLIEALLKRRSAAIRVERFVVSPTSTLNRPGKYELAGLVSHAAYYRTKMRSSVLASAFLRSVKSAPGL